MVLTCAINSTEWFRLTIAAYVLALQSMSHALIAFKLHALIAPLFTDRCLVFEINLIAVASGRLSRTHDKYYDVSFRPELRSAPPSSWSGSG